MKKYSQTVSTCMLSLLLVLAVLLSGCATHSAGTHEPAPATTQQEVLIPQAEDNEFELEAEFEETATESVIDPLSGYNRVMTQVNDKAYFWVLKPVSQGYRAVVPEGGRLAV